MSIEAIAFQNVDGVGPAFIAQLYRVARNKTTGAAVYKNMVLCTTGDTADEARARCVAFWEEGLDKERAKVDKARKAVAAREAGRGAAV